MVVSPKISGDTSLEPGTTSKMTLASRSGKLGNPGKAPYLSAAKCSFPFYSELLQRHLKGVNTGQCPPVQP